MRGGALDIYRRLRLGILAILVILLIGTLGFHLIEGWSWFDGMYMTLITLTTVGYQEIHPLSPAGRVFNVIVLITGFVAVGATLALLTQTLLAFELGAFFSRRRMEKEISRLRDHFIICGAGRVGHSVANELRAYAAPLVFIEKDPAQAQWAVDEGIPVVMGAAATEEVLSHARIEHARGLISAVTSDADNLYIVLTARGMRPDLRIIARVSEETAIPKLRRAGANEVLSPYRGVGRRIAQLMLRPHVIDFLEAAVFGTVRDLQIEEVPVSQRSRLEGKTLVQCEIGKTGVILLGLKTATGPLTFNPGPETVVHAGDFLIAIGKPEHLKLLETLAGS